MLAVSFLVWVIWLLGIRLPRIRMSAKGPSHPQKENTQPVVETTSFLFPFQTMTLFDHPIWLPTL